MTLDDVIDECEKRANHGGESYDHVKASGVLPYLRRLARAESHLSTTRSALERIAALSLSAQAVQIARAALKELE